MKKIRLNALYAYFLGTLKQAVECALSIQRAYMNGQYSSKWASKELDKTMSFAWDRLNLCLNLWAMLNGGFRNMNTELTAANHQLQTITAWIAE